jgi:hypothetical protein
LHPQASLFIEIEQWCCKLRKPKLESIGAPFSNFFSNS